MQPYKIAFFDVDGTLTHHEDGTISPKTKQAILTLQERGIIVAAATGRPLSMCEEIQALGIDIFITANGGHVKHGDQVIHKVPLNPQILKEVIAFAEAQNHGLSFYTDALKVNRVRNSRFAQALKETLFLADYPEEFVEEEEVYLLCLFAAEEMMDAYKVQFPNLFFKRWHPFVLNVLEEEVSKSAAIEKLLNHLGIDKSEAIAFGDGENDMDMLEYVGYGVAMGNGNARLKKIANFVTKKSSEDGIDFALRQLKII